MTLTTSTQTPQPTIHRATTADRDSVVAAMVAGFTADPIVSGWLFPDPETYEEYSSGWFACYADFAIEHGDVWTTGDGIGALIAMPFQAWERAQHDSDLKDRIIKSTGPYAERVFMLDQALAERHPTSPDHLYGAMVGVAPGHRDQHLGTRLMLELLALADQRGLPVYGEASCARNRRFHTSYGLPPIGDPITLPGCDTDLQPLWRPATR